VGAQDRPLDRQRGRDHRREPRGILLRPTAPRRERDDVRLSSGSRGLGRARPCLEHRPRRRHAPTDILAAVREDMSGATLRRLTGAMTAGGLTTTNGSDSSTIYRGTVPARSPGRPASRKANRSASSPLATSPTTMPPSRPLCSTPRSRSAQTASSARSPSPGEPGATPSPMPNSAPPRHSSPRECHIAPRAARDNHADSLDG
jgi:hypothetical protein